MSRAEAVKMGPFIGGLNLVADPSAIENEELAECINFEVDLDGSLVSRPPIRETTGNSSVWTERIVIIGRATFAGGTYVIGSNSNGTYAFDGTTWTTIQSGLVSSIALQYGDYVWIVPKPNTATAGGRWSPSSGFVTDANMPQGEGALFHKSRMWIVPGPNATSNSSRLRFTDVIVGVPFTWNAINYIDVSPGDGQDLVDIVVYNDNLVLFKEGSTYILAYDISPEDAVLRIINTDIGASSVRCTASYENSLFVFHEGKLFEVVNYDFKDASLKVPFVYDTATPSGTTRAENVFICIVGDRLLVRYFNKLYSYGMKTRTWSEWQCANSTLQNIGPLVELPANTVTGVPRTYIAGSSISQHENVFAVKEFHDSTTVESDMIVCSAKTKTFDFDIPFVFKRLQWWGADLFTFEDVDSVIEIVTAAENPSWLTVGAFTWDELNVWGSLLNAVRVEDTVAVNTGTGRIFARFLKSVRFRQCAFKITLRTDGSSLQGPVRVFSLTATVGMKQVVTKDMN